MSFVCQFHLLFLFHLKLFVVVELITQWRGGRHAQRHTKTHARVSRNTIETGSKYREWKGARRGRSCRKCQRRNKTEIHMGIYCIYSMYIYNQLGKKEGK